MTAPNPRRGDPAAVFVAKFVPVPGRGWPDVNARRKRLLKLALKSCGLRCVGLAEESPPGPGPRSPPEPR